MKKQIGLAILVATLAAPVWASQTAFHAPAHQDGLFLDAQTTRARCGVGNYLFRNLAETCGVTAEAKSYEEAMTIIQSSAVTAPVESEAVLFMTGSAKLTEAQKENIEKIAETLLDDSNRKVELRGNADAIGTEAFNNTLSQLRAESVMKELRKSGVKAVQISVKAYGENNPVADNATDEGRSQNRRTDIILQ